MSADLILYRTNATAQQCAEAFAHEYGDYIEPYEDSDWVTPSEMLTENWTTESVWIGQVSWAKAGLDGQWETWVPTAVERIYSLYADYPVLTRGLALETLAALNYPERSHFGQNRVLTDPEAVHANWPSGRRIRRGPYRAVACRSRGVTRDRRAVKQFLNRNLGHRIIPVNA